MSNGPLNILWQGLPLAVSFSALIVALLNARIPKIDSEYNICTTVIKRSMELWDDYNCPREESDESEKILLKILNNAEWACIYTNSRWFMKSQPVKHLEDEILEPFVRCFRQSDEGSDYLRRFIKEKQTSNKTFSELKSGLKRKGIKI